MSARFSNLKVGFRELSFPLTLDQFCIRSYSLLDIQEALVASTNWYL